MLATSGNMHSAARKVFIKSLEWRESLARSETGIRPEVAHKLMVTFTALIAQGKITPAEFKLLETLPSEIAPKRRHEIMHQLAEELDLEALSSVPKLPWSLTWRETQLKSRIAKLTKDVANRLLEKFMPAQKAMGETQRPDPPAAVVKQNGEPRATTSPPPKKAAESKERVTLAATLAAPFGTLHDTALTAIDKLKGTKQAQDEVPAGLKEFSEKEIVKLLMNPEHADLADNLLYALPYLLSKNNLKLNRVFITIRIEIEVSKFEGNSAQQQKLETFLIKLFESGIVSQTDFQELNQKDDLPKSVMEHLLESVTPATKERIQSLCQILQTPPLAPPQLDRKPLAEQIAEIADAPKKQRQALLQNLAQAMCYEHALLFARIHPDELLFDMTKEENRERCNNLSAMTRDLAALNRTISLSLLLPLDLPPEDRAKRIEAYIDLQKILLRRGNFHAVQAINTALSSPSVKRLNQVWENVAPKKHAQYLKTQQQLTGERSYKKYRSALEKLQEKGKGCIPIITVLLGDMTFIRDGNPDHLEESQKWNINKFNLLGRLAKNNHELQRTTEGKFRSATASIEESSFLKLIEKCQALNLIPEKYQNEFNQKFSAYESAVKEGNTTEADKQLGTLVSFFDSKVIDPILSDKLSLAIQPRA